MDADERDICLYLKGWPAQFVGVGEICRRAAGKRRYHEDPNWAVPILTRLVEKGMVESDATGHFRLVAKHKKEKDNKKWVSPEIRKILEKSGKNFDEVIKVEEQDDTGAT
jgi:hypothetical protein